MPVTAKLVNVPTDVILPCAAVVTVPAVVADPAVVAVPALATLILATCVVLVTVKGGVPVITLDVIVLAVINPDTDKLPNVPTDVIFPCAEAVTVSAINALAT